MTDRILGSDLLTAALVHEPAAEILDGSPTTSALTLGALDGPVEVGLWEMTGGIARDTEVDEIFLVLSGAGRVDFADGSSIDLAPGIAVRLHAGERTIWTITAPLRKVYIAG